MNTTYNLPEAKQASPPPLLERPMLFLHIPKTAGTSFLTTLRNIFGDQYLLRLKGWGPDLQKQIAEAAQVPITERVCMTGHMPIHYTTPYADRFRFFTILRNPVTRVMSLFRFLHGIPSADLARMGLKPDFTFDDFIRSRAPELYAQINNGMCRLLCGDPRMSDSETPEFWNIGKLPSMATIALNNLQTCDFGLAEKMPETLHLLRTVWGIPYALDEYTHNTTEHNDHSENIQNFRLIVRQNTLDIALYEKASSLFHARMSSWIPTPDSIHPTTIFPPHINKIYPIAEIPGRQGFHDLETNGFAWTMSHSTARIHFKPPAASCQMILRFYRITPKYPIEQIILQLNGRKMPFSVIEQNDQWATIATDNEIMPTGINQLIIQSPYFVPVAHINPDVRDKRSLSIALSTICFQIKP
jgi:hypothetical protein